jgi:hypothetical protein
MIIYATVNIHGNPKRIARINDKIKKQASHPLGKHLLSIAASENLVQVLSLNTKRAGNIELK